MNIFRAIASIILIMVIVLSALVPVSAEENARGIIYTLPSGIVNSSFVNISHPNITSASEIAIIPFESPVYYPISSTEHSMELNTTENTQSSFIYKVSPPASGNLYNVHSSTTNHTTGNVTSVNIYSPENITFPKTTDIHIGKRPVSFITDAATGSEYVSDEVIVRFNTAMVRNNRAMSISSAVSHAKIGAEVKEDFSNSGLSGMQVVKLPSTISVNDAIAEYQKSPDVLYAQPNYMYHTTSVIPNDPFFSSQWGLHNVVTPGADIDAPDAWSISTGSSTVVVAVIDTGIDYNHPDLSSNIWTNPGETGPDSQGNDKRFNGIDDDNNGYIDDWHGWNFFSNTSDPMDGNTNKYHGTHVSGILGAVGNNSIGVTGVNWNVKIMPLRTTDENGNSYTSTNMEAIYYASVNGASVISNSWGGDGYDQALKDAIDNSPAVVVCAAGNDNVNTDVSPFYPASFDSPNIISVAATNSSDNKATFSNYGQISVDLAAPGVYIYSTKNNSTYQFMSGTSMATPFVSGVAALVKSVNPQLTNVQIKNIILTSVDVKPSLTGIVSSDGRLNGYKAVLKASSLFPPVANFTARPRSGTAPLTVVFTDLSSDATAWNWTFGDGSAENATVQNPVHTYLNNGTYTINLNVSNVVGINSLTKSDFILVGSMSRTGVFRGSGYWYLDINNNGQWDGPLIDRAFYWGKQPGDTPIPGDWTGDGITKTGVFRGLGYWYLDMNNNGVWDGPSIDRAFYWGKQPGDIPITGDWTGDGITKTGVFRGQGNWYLDMNNNGVWDAPPTDKIYYWGKQPGDIPITGDWTGDRITKTGIFRPGDGFYLDMNNNGVWDAPPTDKIFTWGNQPGDMPITGDWTGDGITKIGIFRPGIGLYLDINNNGIYDGPSIDRFLQWGLQPGDKPVIGRW